MTTQVSKQAENVFRFVSISEVLKMAINIANEKPITFDEAGLLLPHHQKPSHCTWWRWSRKGTYGVVLETVVVGGRRFTTAEAVHRWIVNTTAAATDPKRRRRAG